MNYNNACNILDLNITFNERELKHNYYMKALKFHPDKNKDINAKKDFQEILDAYEYLKDSKNIDNDYECNNESSSESSNINEESYIDILEKFANGIVDKNINITKFLSILNNKYTKISCELLKQFPKPILMKLHKFTSQYSDILYINNDILLELDKLIEEHTKNDNIILLNPTIENLLNDEVYKLEIEDETYYIPLWHHELIYEISNNSIIIQCEPVLPDYISIDQHNNLYVNLSTSLTNILNRKNININIGNRNYNIIVSELYIKKYQRYIIKNKGVAFINTNDIYNINNRCNIYIDIHLTDILE
mgnify:CR=1 FL=1